MPALQDDVALAALGQADEQTTSTHILKTCLRPPVMRLLGEPRVKYCDNLNQL